MTNRHPLKKDDMPWLWPAVAVMLFLFWVGYLVTETPNWLSLGLGFVTGGLLIAWAIELTGNKLFSSSDDSAPD